MYGLSSFFIDEQKVAEARADDAGGAERGDARVPLHPDRGRGPSRAVLQPLLRGSRGAQVGHPPGPARRDRRAREPGVQRALRRVAQGEGRRPGARIEQPGAAGRGGNALPHDHRGHARPDRPALHHRVQRGRGTLPGFVEGCARATSTGMWPSVPLCARWRSGTTAITTPSSGRSWSAGPAADGVRAPLGEGAGHRAAGPASTRRAPSR